MTRVSEEYAAALFTLAAEENVGHEVADSLKTVRTLALEYPDYIDLLASVNIPIDERCQVIDNAFGAALHEYAVSFIKLLCERGHIRDLDECIDEYMKLYEASYGIATANITSAVTLTDEEKETLKRKLEAKLSRRVELVCQVDESILGGIVIRVDGNIMDGSIRTKLAELGDVIGN